MFNRRWGGGNALVALVWFLQKLGAMESDLRVYELRFAERGALSRAFDQVNADPDVASCSFEVVPRRIRLLARRAVAERLVERFYLEGGLCWCSRHAFGAEP